MKRFMIISLFLCFVLHEAVEAQTSKPTSAFKIARLKYSGGGDWYNGPTEEPNLLRYIRQHTLIDVEPTYEFVEIVSDRLFTYPFLFMTGHGNVVFSDAEARRLRTYLENGGFLYADDDYGMDKAFRHEIKKIFPDQQLVELPFSHGLFHAHSSFQNGVPKIHEHDGNPPQAFGLFHKGRLVVLYTYESNPSDGWDDLEVHNTSPQKHDEALRFGTNIVVWALTN
jgi:hypothetical protein